MQTKVKEIKIHVGIPTGSKMILRDILVAEGKLILVECKPEEAILYQQDYINTPTINHYSFQYGLVKGIGKYLKPIIISETETITYKGESFYNSKTERIFIQNMWEEMQIFPKETESKILVLSEQFSPEQLQTIVDGRLKNGDKVKVECEKKHIGKYEKYYKPLDGGKEYGINPLSDTIIKLNSQGHVTLFPVEEKMYTIEQVKSVLKEYERQFKWETSAYTQLHRWKYYSIDDWFDKNVK